MKTIAMLAVAWVVLLGSGGSVVAEDGLRGQALFKLCSSCHGVDGAGDVSVGAPAIAGLDLWYVEAQLQKFKGGLRGAHPDDIAGLRMRPMTFTLKNDADLSAVAGYVANLPPVEPAVSLEGGDAAKGQTAYTLCMACHGAAGEGNKALNGPPLNRLNDWYLLLQLEKFKAGIRGGDPRDVNAIMMRPMALTLVDEQAMKDVIAYIVTLGK